MKKFAVILLVVFFSSISLAHIGHYNKFDKIEMEILRNDEVIGYNNYFFKRDGEKTIVKNQYKFEVKLLSATIFKVEGYGEEIYLKDNLISFQSKTLQNKKEKFVYLKLNKNNNKFEYAGAAGGFIDKYGIPFCRGRIINTIEEDLGQYNKNVEIF